MILGRGDGIPDRGPLPLTPAPLLRPSLPSSPIWPTPPPPHWDVHFNVQSHLPWVQSRLMCSLPHENNIFHLTWKKIPTKSRSNPISSNKVLYESPIISHCETYYPVVHTFLLSVQKRVGIKIKYVNF